MSLEELVEISRYYGKNPDYVLAGGGNTSWKDNDTLYVKASGFSLAEASVDSFVQMDRKALAGILSKKYPASDKERESAVLADMMSAKKTGQEGKRPSVEALLHEIFPFPFTVHLHPALVNGFTCSQRGEHAMKDIFGNDAIWIPSANPGYVLSLMVKKEIDAYFEKHSCHARIVFLQNHGVFAGADSLEGVKELYEEIMLKIGAKINRKPDFSDEKLQDFTTNQHERRCAATRTTESNQITGSCCLHGSWLKINEIVQTLKEHTGAAAFMIGSEISALVKNRDSFAPFSSAFTPDHIVYSGSDPLFTEAQTAEGLLADMKNHAEKTGRNPKIIAVRGLGIFSAAATEKAAKLALELFRDTIKVAVYSQSFGGPLFMTQDKIDFINNWEVERFRSNISTK